MPDERNWSRLLGLLDARTRPVAFIAIILDLIALATIPLLPSGQRIYGFVLSILVLLASLVAIVRLTKQAKAKDHTRPNLESKVARLKDVLVADAFLPDLIIAIPRSGLVVAGLLAHALGNKRVVPVISPVRDNSLERQFDNPFNRLSLRKSDFSRSVNRPIKVLLLDDICASGRTLAAAKDYVEDSLGKIDFEVRTAAISFYTTHHHAEAPSFVVERPAVAIRDASGDVEAMPY